MKFWNGLRLLVGCLLFAVATWLIPNTPEGIEFLEKIAKACK